MKTVGPMLTAGQVAAMFNVDPKTVNRWSRAGRIPAAWRTPGGHWRYHRSDIEAFIRDQQAERGT